MFLQLTFNKFKQWILHKCVLGTLFIQRFNLNESFLLVLYVHVAHVCMKSERKNTQYMQSAKCEITFILNSSCNALYFVTKASLTVNDVEKF